MQNTKQNETRTPSIREQVLNPVDSSQILETGYLPSINQKKANSEKTLGNTFQRALDTIEDTGISGIKGFGKFFEGFVDFITGAASGIGTMFGADMSELDDFTKRDLTSELLDNEIFMHILRAPDVIGYINDNWTKSDVESNSYISEMGQRGQNISRGVSEAVGQIWAQILLAKLTGGIGNAMSTTGQISAGAQQAINLAALGTSVTGSSVEESLNNDEKIGRALLYGVVSGATEAGIEMISGGVQNKLMGVTKTAVNMEKVMGNVAKNRTARLALTLLGDAAGEGVEEMISEIVDPIEKKLILEHKENVDPATLESVLTAGLIGALSSGLFGGGKIALHYKSNVAAQIMEDMNDARQKYAESDFTDEDTKAYNDAISGYKSELESILNSMKPENRKKFAFDVDNKTGVLKARNSAFEGYDYENNAFNEEAWNKSNEVKTFKDSTTVKMSEERAEQVKGLRSFFDRANKQARGLSANIEIVDTLGKDADGNLNNAAYDDKTNTIKIAADADPKKTFTALAIHELTHSTYKTISMNAIRAWLKEKRPNLFNATKESIKDLYEGASEELLEEETVAHVLENSFYEQEFIDQLYQEKPTLFKRIYNKIKSWLKGDFKTKAEREYKKILKELASLFENAINQKNAGIELSEEEKSEETKNSKSITKSPLSYEGSKRSMMDDLLRIFPDNVNNFYDVFGGSGVVSMNVDYGNVNYNEANPAVAGLLEYLKNTDTKTIVEEVNKIKSLYDLNTAEGYRALRSHYNKTRNPIELFVLNRLSHSQTMRFNSKGEFNQTFGNYNADNQLKNVKQLVNDYKEAIKDKKFNITKQDAFDILDKAKEGDFVYLDPPYLGTQAGYNSSWKLEDDLKLFKKLDELDKKGVKWAMSNVFENKNVTTEQRADLINWAKKYNVEHFNKNYASHGKSGSADEVVITNYTNDGAKYSKSAKEGREIDNDFRRIQEESERISNEEQQLLWRTGTSTDGELQKRLSRVFRQWLKSRSSKFGNGNELNLKNKKGFTFKLYQDVDGETFHNIFKIARTYLKNGELVDVHPIQSTEDELGYNDTKNYISNDGLSGFAITKDGDLISVYNLNSSKRGFLQAISKFVKENAKTLDCYNSPNQPLAEIYQKELGFKTASMMDYNMDYDHDNIAQNHKNPQVAFMVNSTQDVVEEHFDENSYDAAKEHQMEYVESQVEEPEPARRPTRIERLQEQVSDLRKERNELKRLYSSAFTQNVILDMKKTFLEIEKQGLEIINEDQAKEIFDLKKKQHATEQELVNALIDADLLARDVEALKDINKRANKLEAKLRKLKEKKKVSYNKANIRNGAEIDNMIDILSGIEARGYIKSPANTKEQISKFLKLYTPDNPLFRDFYDDNLAFELQAYVDGFFDRNRSGRLVHGIKVLGNDFITRSQIIALDHLISLANRIINSQTQVIKDGIHQEVNSIIQDNRYDEQVVDHYKNNKDPNAVGRIIGKYGEAVAKSTNIAQSIDESILKDQETGFVQDLLNEIHKGKERANIAQTSLKKQLYDFNKKHKNYIRKLRYNNSKTHFEIIDSEGKTHRVSKGQAIYYYMLNMREQGKKHINVDYNPAAKGIKSYDKNGYEINKPYTLNDATFKDIESKLTTIDKEFIDVAKKIFEMGGKMKQYTDGLRMGYTNAIEKNYIPIVNDIFNRNVRLGKVQNNTIENLFNLAFNMEVEKNANSYVSNANILEVLNKYIRQISNYAGGMTSVEYVNNMLNYRVNDMTMLEMINARHPNFKSWFNKYISDVFQVNMPDRTSALFSELRKAYSRAALGLNVKVWMTQITSYSLAFTQLKASSLAYGLKGFRQILNFKGRTNAIEEIAKYAPSTYVRTKENVILLAESNTTEALVNDVGRFLDFTTAPIAHMDFATIYALWEACQKDVETRLGLKIGTEENKIEAGKLLDSVVAETQPNFDAENSPAIRRSQNEIIRTLMMFRTQPFQMLNVLIGTVNNMVNLKKRLAWFEGKAEGVVDPYGKTKAQVEEMAKTVKVRAVKSGTAVFTATLSYALVAALFARLLGRVDDKDELENVRDQFIASFISMFPITNALYQMLYEGYSLSSSPIEYIDSLFSNMKKVIDNPSKNNVWAFVKSFSQMTGVPLKNLTDYIGGILNLFDPAKAYKYKNLFYTQPATTDKKIIDAAIETNRDKLGEVSLENYLSKKGIRDLNNSYYSSVYDLIKQDSDRLSKLSTSPLTTGDEIKYADDSTYQATRQDVSSYNIRASASLNSLINSSYYKKLSDDDKVKANKKVATTVKAVTTLKYGKVSKNKLANAAKYFGFKEEELVSFYYYLRSLKSEGKEKVLATINKSKYNTYQKLVLKDLLGYKLSDIEQNSVSNHVASLSKSTKELLFKNL